MSSFSQIFYFLNPTFNMTHLLYTQATQPYAKYCCQYTIRNTFRCLVAIIYKLNTSKFLSVKKLPYQWINIRYSNYIFFHRSVNKNEKEVFIVFIEAHFLSYSNLMSNISRINNLVQDCTTGKSWRLIVE